MSFKIMIINYILSFILFFGGGILLMIFLYTDVVLYGIKIQIQEPGYSDPTKICRMYKCNYITKDGNIYKNVALKNHYPNLERLKGTLEPIISMNNVEFYKPLSMKVIFYNGIMLEYIIIDLMGIFDLLSSGVFFWILGIFLIDILSIFILHRYFSANEKQYAIRSENEVYYNSLMLMSENINHEINTPLCVLHNKIETLNGIFSSVSCPFSTNCGGCVGDDFRNSPIIKRLNLSYIFKTMRESINQIGAVTKRIKELKQIKYSENHKPIYEIFKTAMDILYVAQNDQFSYEIPEDLKLFKLKDGILTDSDLLGIILNHITNSIEAHSTFIKIHINRYSKDHFRFGSTLKVLILDNGNGIPKHLVNKIYNTNFSSKGTGRGNGLSVNQFVMTRGGGEIKLIETSEKGTIFELSFGVEKFEEIKTDINENSPLMSIPDINNYK